MDSILIYSAALKLFYAFVAVVLVWVTVLILRRSTDRDIRQVLNRIDSDALAAAIYWSVTFFGICYVVGQAIG